MRLTAKQIADWAATGDGRTGLPRLVRRLINRTGTIKQISVPAGDSVGQPGWDGDLLSETGSAWVPKGESKWEMSCREDCLTKANEDYEKRIAKISAELRQSATYLCVTGRLWPGKSRWQSEKRASGHWADVRVYDADDLEQWLEETPGVALQFAEELGLSGPEVESLQRHWSDWAQQSTVPISPDAIFIGREAVRDRLMAALIDRLGKGQQGTYGVRADSVEEATAFVCATLLNDADMAASALVVTNARGWHFVEKNAAIRLAIAARPEVAENPARRSGLTVIIPYAAGDMVGRFREQAGQDEDADLVIERPRSSEFEKALVVLGLDEGDAERLATTTGRSWSVFRRRHAANPAIRRPAWLDSPQSRALSTLCLLGAWSAQRQADREIVARLSARPYEDVERDLRHLALLDDAPAIEIGETWKAKSALELLDLFGDRITRDELRRFFEVAQEILSAPDPQLELPENERYAAQVHGKVRPHSGLLVESICDTLVKLAVRGPQVSALGAANIDTRVAWLIRDLLADADRLRWLSLASLLPALAEAAPNEFLYSIEHSLEKPDAPVTQLLSETSESGIFGRCWHAGLLWALETLAWAPQRLARVALILARLSHIEIKGNWGNSPRASLLDLFRSWIPQTAAEVDQRIEVLDKLIEREPDVSFDLLDHIVNVGHDTASPSARPKWRDDDSGAGRGATGEERHKMLVAAVDWMIEHSKRDAERIARLVTKADSFDPPRVSKVLLVATEFADSGVSDQEKETIRKAVRHKIYWHRNYDDVRGAALDQKLKRFEALYDALTPLDLIVRHQWLFADSWPELPIRVREESHEKRSELIHQMRIDAAREIYDAHGISGIVALTKDHGNQYLAGFIFAKLELPAMTYASWLARVIAEPAARSELAGLMVGLLRGMNPSAVMGVVTAALELGEKLGWDKDRVVNLLTAAPEDRPVWDLAASLGAEVEDEYWARCRGDLWFRDEQEKTDFALRRLLIARRSRSAFQVCRFDFEKVDPNLVAEILEGLLRMEEVDGPKLDSYRIGEAIDYLEQSGAIERDRLIRLEFGLIPALGYDEAPRAATLYVAIMSDPKLFTDLLCALYKPAHGERDEPITENLKMVAEIAWRVLRECRRQPGTMANGSVDHEAFARFIEEVRDLCRKADRLGVCDSTLGQIIAHAPTDSDGTWPFKPARDVLDRPEMEDLRRGFLIGVRNSRGVTTRAHDEGGKQEHQLAQLYRQRAKRLENSHPTAAALINTLADGYERDGLSEDLEAKLRREGH